MLNHSQHKDNLLYIVESEFQDEILKLSKNYSTQCKCPFKVLCSNISIIMKKCIHWT